MQITLRDVQKNLFRHPAVGKGWSLSYFTIMVENGYMLTDMEIDLYLYVAHEQYARS